MKKLSGINLWSPHILTQKCALVPAQVHTCINTDSTYTHRRNAFPTSTYHRPERTHGERRRGLGKGQELRTDYLKLTLPRMCEGPGPSVEHVNAMHTRALLAQGKIGTILDSPGKERARRLWKTYHLVLRAL